MNKNLLFSLLLATSLCNIHASFFSLREYFEFSSPKLSPKAQELVQKYNDFERLNEQEAYDNVKKTIKTIKFGDLNNDQDREAIKKAVEKAKQQLVAKTTFTPYKQLKYWLKNILTSHGLFSTVSLGFATGYAFKNGHIFQNMATPYMNQENAKLLTAALPLTLAVATTFGAAGTLAYATGKMHGRAQWFKENEESIKQETSTRLLVIDKSLESIYPRPWSK